VCRGTSSRVTSRPGRRRGSSSAAGETPAYGPRSWGICWVAAAKRPARTRSRPPLSWTPNRCPPATSAPATRSEQTRQTQPRPQTTPAHRPQRPADRDQRHQRSAPRLARRAEPARNRDTAAHPAYQGVRRRRRRRPGRTCGCRTRRHGRHQATSRRNPLVRPAPAAVARRADLRLHDDPVGEHPSAAGDRGPVPARFADDRGRLAGDGRLALPQPPAPPRLRGDRDLVPDVRPPWREEEWPAPRWPRPRPAGRGRPVRPWPAGRRSGANGAISAQLVADQPSQRGR